MQRNVKALKVGNSFVPSLTFVRRMTAGKFGAFVVLLHAFLLTPSAVVKAFGADLKNEVAKVSKAAFHTARVLVFFLTSTHLVFSLHGGGATGACETTNAFAESFPTARKKSSSSLLSCAPDSHRFRQNDDASQRLCGR